MEKRRPTYDLDAVKAVLGFANTLVLTGSAVRSALQLGFDLDEIADTIQSIERRMFVKSMTTYADHRVWQDVYHVPKGALTLYVKFQADIISEFRLMSFKEMGDA